MKSPSKAPAKMNKPAKIHKDGYGAHWHSVGWLAAIALVLSASTMTLSASAQTTSITPSTLLRGINEIKVQLSRVEAKIDRLGTQCGPAAAAQCPTPAAATENSISNTINRENVTSPVLVLPNAPAKELLTDVTKCRLGCEDDFKLCTLQASNNNNIYAFCKANYEACWTKCGQ